MRHICTKFRENILNGFKIIELQSGHDFQNYKYQGGGGVIQ